MKHAIPTDWDGTFCRFSICWPDSTLWRAILRGLVTEPARGFFWDEKTGSIRGILADFRKTVDQNLELEGVIMSCSDATALIEAINTNFANLTEAIAALQLAVTVQPANPTITVEPASPTITVQSASPDVTLTCSPDVNLTCGSGGSGSGGPYSSGHGPYGQGPINQPPANPGQVIPGPGPGGYNPPVSWPGTPVQYDEYKCRASGFLVDAYITYIEGWVNNYQNIGNLFTVTQWIEALFGVSPWALILEPAALIVVASYLATVEVGAWISQGLLSSYLDYLRTERDNWMCDFYNAKTVDEARAAATNYIGGGGYIVFPGPVRDFHVGNFFKNATLNILFEEYGPAAAYDVLDDCSECNCPNWEVTQNEAYDGIFEVSDDTLTVTTGPLSEHAPGCFYGWVVLVFSCPTLLELVSTSGSPPSSCDGSVPRSKWQAYKGGMAVHTGNTDPEIGYQMCVDSLAIQTNPGGATTVFTIVTKGC